MKKTYKQIGTSIRSIDQELKAMQPGWRTSDSGTKYFENRKNRTDAKGKRT